MRGARRGLVVAVVGTLLLAGCVSIPTSGSVQTATIDTEPDDINQIALPESPQTGQDMAQILQGFIRAGRGPQNGYQVAREYLAPGVTWNGTERVLVSSTRINPVQVDDDTMSLTLTVVAEVDQSGRYVQLPVPSQQTLLYDFTVVDGEYRISAAEPGTILNPSGFSIAFDEYPLFFFDPSFSYLVPDLRWFPRTRVASRIVTELLAGPSPWLGSGVLVSAFPQGTSGQAVLDAPGVDVDLDAAVRAESPVTQLRMIQQLRASLRSLSNVVESQIEVTAEDLALAPAPEEAIPESRFTVSGLLVGVDGVVGMLTTEGLSPLALIESRADGLQPSRVALARDRRSLAVLGPGGVSVVRATGDPVAVDSRPGLVAPTIDPYGFVWSVPADAPGGIIATGVDGVPHPVPFAADGRVVSIKLSRDGARLLVALATAEGPRLLVAGVLRDAALAPVGLNQPLELPVASSIVDVTWVDISHVGVLSTDGAHTQVEVLALGGPSQSLGSLEGGVEIVGANSVEGIRVLTTDGTVLRPSGTGRWVDTTLVASFLGTQQ